MSDPRPSTEEERRARLLQQLAPRTSWLSRLRGWLARRKQDKLERKRAEQRRLEHEQEQRVPRFVCSIIGSTTYMEGAQELYTTPTHRWDLYETGAGERSVKFIQLQGYGGRPGGDDHQRHARIVKPWLERKLELDYAKTLAAPDKPVGWYRS